VGFVGHDPVASGDYQNLVAAVPVPSRLRACLEINDAGVEKITLSLWDDGLTRAVHLAARPSWYGRRGAQRYLLYIGYSNYSHLFPPCVCVNLSASGGD
jgi:hypothetical protein